MLAVTYSPNCNLSSTLAEYAGAADSSAGIEKTMKSNQNA